MTEPDSDVRSTVFWLPAFRRHLFAVALGCIAGEKPARLGGQAYEEHRFDWITLHIDDRGAA